jgi:hypothetical protein
LLVGRSLLANRKHCCRGPWGTAGWGYGRRACKSDRKCERGRASWGVLTTTTDTRSPALPQKAAPISTDAIIRFSIVSVHTAYVCTQESHYVCSLACFGDNIWTQDSVILRSQLRFRVATSLLSLSLCHFTHFLDQDPRYQDDNLKTSTPSTALAHVILYQPTYFYQIVTFLKCALRFRTFASNNVFLFDTVRNKYLQTIGMRRMFFF